MASRVYCRSTDRPPPRSSKGYETEVPRHKSADQVLDTLAAHCRRAQMQDSSCRLERVRARSVSRGPLVCTWLVLRLEHERNCADLIGVHRLCVVEDRHPEVVAAGHVVELHVEL